GLFEKLSPEGLVYAIIGVNAAVFVVWGSAGQRAKSLGDVRLMSWMMKHFTVMWHNLQSGRLWTLVTPAFSHREPLHFLSNMFVLYMFGADIIRIVGKRRFILFYLGAAVCGNLLSAVIRGVVLPATTGDRTGITQPGMGASTAVMGITTLFACLYPTSTIIVFFVPMPAWVAASGVIAWDLWRVFNAHRTRIDGAGHLGGALAGLGYY
ncbi:rhomboid-domain-containing protein, partial [Coemansia reversa NRRL 1564]